MPSCISINIFTARSNLAYEFIIIIIIINIFLWCHKVVTSEALGPGSVILRRGKRESSGEEECP